MLAIKRLNDYNETIITEHRALLKIYYLTTFKKGQKWPNGQTILFLANSFKKGHICQIWPLKRPNGNPDLYFTLSHVLSLYFSPSLYVCLIL